MTQKELSYVEDAIGHEQNIISIFENIMNNLTDEKLVIFLTNEINSHKKTEKKLTNLLEVKSNE